MKLQMAAYSLAFDFNPILEIIRRISYEATNLVIRSKLNDHSLPGSHLYLGMMCICQPIFLKVHTKGKSKCVIGHWYGFFISCIWS